MVPFFIYDLFKKHKGINEQTSQISGDVRKCVNQPSVSKGDLHCLYTLTGEILMVKTPVTRDAYSLYSTQWDSISVHAYIMYLLKYCLEIYCRAGYATAA